MTREEVFDRLNTVFQDVFDDSTLTIDDSMNADDIDGWDSLAQISLIAAVESEFGLRFDMKTALHLNTPSAIADAVLARVNH